MTLQAVLAWSIGRALIITTLSLPLALLVWRWVASQYRSPRVRHWLCFVALLPLFVPDLLVGFTYWLTSANLVHSVAATEGLYALLLLFRTIALQTAVALILPASVVSPEALHSWRLLKNTSLGNGIGQASESQTEAPPAWRVPLRSNFAWWLQWVRLLLIGPWRMPLVAWIGGALLCFQEFETAALLQVDRHPIVFTVWLFDAHAAGESLTTSLRMVSRSIFFQLTLLLPAILLLRSGGLGQSRQRTTPGSSENAVVTWSACGILFVSLAIVLAWPVIQNGQQFVSGFRSLIDQGAVWARSEQILISVLVAALSSVAALQISVGLRSLKSRWLTLAAILPGLCGALVLSLVLLAAFQLPVLHDAYDTWLPMLLGQTLLILPRAFLLVVLLEVTSSPFALHSATLMTRSSDNRVAGQGRHVLWRLKNLRWLLATAVLTHWCLWDVTTTATLRPTRFEPIINRLYNEMHYRSTETLVAITALTLLIPFVVFVVAAMAWKFVSTRSIVDG
ncbi:hypothetical protein [Fuerstiella marisgermanici]|uniref:ABC transmembrane type-1 domain-containing protein n=1 Tax=Fuerstiella marisgermanici TaxID=1891926 RepID=A0A1P8WQI3_9PLAN|nr:hypothetical protein [Fuerstiella marisgermanici]APZ96320.1 hypothetical protein Fuma_05988 [Fuerstiella marisgermanici]